MPHMCIPHVTVCAAENNQVFVESMAWVYLQAIQFSAQEKLSAEIVLGSTRLQGQKAQCLKLNYDAKVHENNYLADANESVLSRVEMQCHNTSKKITTMVMPLSKNNQSVGVIRIIHNTSDVVIIYLVINRIIRHFLSGYFNEFSVVQPYNALRVCVCNMCSPLFHKDLK